MPQLVIKSGMEAVIVSHGLAIPQSIMSSATVYLKVRLGEKLVFSTTFTTPWRSYSSFWIFLGSVAL